MAGQHWAPWPAAVQAEERGRGRGAGSQRHGHALDPVCHQPLHAQPGVAISDFQAPAPNTQGPCRPRGAWGKPWYSEKEVDGGKSLCWGWGGLFVFQTSSKVLPWIHRGNEKMSLEDAERLCAFCLPCPGDASGIFTVSSRMCAWGKDTSAVQRATSPV